MIKRFSFFSLFSLTLISSFSCSAALTAVGDTNASSSNDPEVIINDEVVVGDSVSGTPSSPSGELHINDGTNVTISNQYLHVGRLAGSAGLITVNGDSSVLNFDQFLNVGEGGFGQLDITDGGTVNLTGNVFSSFAKQTGSSAIVNVSGEGSTFNATGAVRVGENGQAVLNVTDGAVFKASQILLGYSSGGSGTVIVSNGSQLSTENAMSIGNLGTGLFIVQSGAQVTSSDVRIGSLSNSSGSLQIDGSGSHWNAGTGVITVGASGSGVLTLSNGGELQGDALILGQRSSGQGVLNIGGAAGDTALAPGQLTLANGVSFGEGGGEVNFNHTSSDYTFNSAITGNGEVNVLSGTTLLQGNNTYSGNTTVEGGELGAGAANSLSENSDFKIDTAGTLSLNGFSQRIASLENGGTVSLKGTSPGTLLTITGNYTGNNGLLIFNSELGDDASLTDRLIVEGDTSGTTRVQVNNLGGSGANTLNGIEIITVNGASDGIFSEDGRIAAGAYDYHLTRGEGSDAGNWYLSNEKDESGGGDGGAGEGGGDGNPGEGGGGESGIAVIRPEGGVYAANQAAMRSMFNVNLSDRQGETKYTDSLTGEEKSTSLWMKNTGGHTRSNDVSDQLKIRSNSYALIMGGDIANHMQNNNSWHIGALAGYGSSHSNVDSRLTGYRAKGSVQGYTTGLYGTWYGQGSDLEGIYLDSVLQYSWFNNNVDGEDIAGENYKSDGLQTTIETGWVFGAGQSEHMGWYLKPHIQVGWNGVKMDSHQESNGTRVNGEGEDNVRVKAGIRFFGDGHSSLDEGKNKSFRPYIETNYIHNTKLAGASMDNIPVIQSGTRNMGEVGAGIQGMLTENVNVTGAINQAFGDKGYSSSMISLGMKYTF